MRLTGRRRARVSRGVERGSALALVPAGFLVLIILAAITVDSAVAFLGQRQLGDALAAAANDAAGAAISNSSFYGSGEVVIDPTAATAVICQTVAAQDSGLHQMRLQIAVAGAVIGVRGTAQVDEVFGRALPGLHDHEVSAVATATAAEGPAAAGPAAAGVTAAGVTAAGVIAADYHTISCEFKRFS